MVEIIKNTSSGIELSGVKISDGEKMEIISNVCHKWKHMFKEGYPYGRKTRKERQERLKKWSGCPKICFTYLFTDDTAGHHLAIQIFVSYTEAVIKKYSEDQIEYYKCLYTQNVADEILKELNH